MLEDYAMLPAPHILEGKVPGRGSRAHFHVPLDIHTLNPIRTGGPSISH